MSALSRAVVLTCLSTLAVAQMPDQLAAERALGPHWRQISRASGIIFVGTVLDVEAQPASHDRPVPAIQTRFRVERAIAGTHLKQVVTIREWTAAGTLPRSVRSGQRTLYFFYPPSRLGLTSSVGGPLTQIAIDRYGNVIPPAVSAYARTAISHPARAASARPAVVSLDQLERAIRSARMAKE